MKKEKREKSSDGETEGEEILRWGKRREGNPQKG